MGCVAQNTPVSARALETVVRRGVTVEAQVTIVHQVSAIQALGDVMKGIPSLRTVSVDPTRQSMPPVRGAASVPAAPAAVIAEAL